jgi:tetratricopeptide (TPR) repeat protein
MGAKILLLIVAIASPVHTQTARLVDVRSPDLSNLEASVREQIIAAHSELAAAARSPATTLSEEYGKLGQIYHAYALLAAARDCYLNASTLAPKDFRSIYLLAKLDQQEGRFDDAIRRYLVARALRPDYVAVPVNLGNIFLELNRLAEAHESFSAALEIDKNNAAAHYGLGQVAASKRNYAEAVDHFEKTLAQVPGANRVHYSLAMAYRGLGDAEKAKAHLAQQGSVGVRVADPLVDGLQDLITGERVYLARGKVAFEARRYVDAVNEFRKAVAAKPDSVTARINLGAALTQVGDVNGAVGQFEEALRLDAGRLNAHYNLAVLLAGQNKHAQAITHLRSVLSVDENDLNARFLLARELKNSERFDESLAEYARVVQSDSNNEDALLDYVRLLYRKGQFKNAMELLEKAHAQYPQKGRTVVLLVYMLASSPDVSLRNGTRALDLAQRVYGASNAAPHAALIALALAELGRCPEAADWQRRAITTAEREGNAALLENLRATLNLYSTQPCRPQNDPLLDQLLEKD